MHPCPRCRAPVENDSTTWCDVCWRTVAAELSARCMAGGTATNDGTDTEDRRASDGRPPRYASPPMSEIGRVLNRVRERKKRHAFPPSLGGKCASLKPRQRAKFVDWT